MTILALLLTLILFIPSNNSQEPQTLVREPVTALESLFLRDRGQYQPDLLIKGSFLKSNQPPVTIEPTTLGSLMTPEIRELAICESTMNPNAINENDIHYNADGSISIGSFGLLQYSIPTFEEYAPKAGVINPDIMNPRHQIKTAKYMLELGLGERWSCY